MDSDKYSISLTDTPSIIIKANFNETLLMTKLIRPGRTLFAIGIISLGILQFFAKDFIVGRPPAATRANNIPGKLAWAYTSGILLIIAGGGILFNMKAK